MIDSTFSTDNSREIPTFTIEGPFQLDVDGQLLDAGLPNDAWMPETAEYPYELDARMAILQSPEATVDDKEMASTDLFNEFFPVCLDYARKILRDEGKAEDVAMQTLATVTLKAHQYRPLRPLQNWVITVAKNKAINQYRSDKRRETVSYLGIVASAEDDYFNAASLSTQTQVDHEAEVLADYAELLEKLSGVVNPDFFRILKLFVDGYHYKEIAEMESIPIGTVMSRMHRARVAARAILKA